MNWFLNQKIFVKLSIGFGLCLAFACLNGYVSNHGFGLVTKAVSKVEKDSVPGLVAMTQISEDMNLVRQKQLRIAGTSNRELETVLLREINELRTTCDTEMAQYQKTISGTEETKNFELLKQAWAKYNRVFTSMQDRLTAKDSNASDYEEFDTNSGKIFKEELSPTIQAIIQWNSKEALKGISEVKSSISAASRISLIVLGIAIAMGITMSLFSAKSITKPVTVLISKFESIEKNCLTSFENAIRGMEKGDLTQRVVPVTTPVENPAKDEIGYAGKVFNDMLRKTQSTIASYESTRSNLSDLIGTLKENAETVAATSAQLDRASEETGQAANSIASTMQQVSVSSDEAAKSASQIAGSSEQLAVSATKAAGAMEQLQLHINDVQGGGRKQAVATSEASETAEEVSKSVGETVASMERIQAQVQSSSNAVRDLGQKGQQIGAIVQTIEDIAQQTNLLALNAAIEAARAGEQGKGFAVVADEVRKLAERSASATKEIADLIESVRSGVDQAVTAMEASNAEVAQGAATSARAGTAISQIITAVATVGEIAEANSKAIELMESGAKVVSEAISAAAAISEETAAGAEEMSAATEEVSASAQTVTAAVEEQTAQIEEVGASAQHLRKLAEDLNEIASQFTVEQSTTPKLRVAA